MDRRIKLLQPNHAGCFITVNKKNPVNYGVVKIENDILYYLKRKTMLLMYKDLNVNEMIIDKIKKDDMKYLMKHKYVKTISLSDIDYVLF